MEIVTQHKIKGSVPFKSEHLAITYRLFAISKDLPPLAGVMPSAIWKIHLMLLMQNSNDFYGTARPHSIEN